MSAISHIHAVIVPVDDQDAALAFYTGKLGFEVRVDGEFAPGQRWLEVGAAGRPDVAGAGARRSRPRACGRTSPQRTPPGTTRSCSGREWTPTPS